MTQQNVTPTVDLNSFNDDLSYNEYVFTHVLDTKGFTSEVQCSRCSSMATERVFDENVGGCINQVYTIDCPHCGYHECDQEYCETCIEQMDEHISSEQELMNKAISIERLFFALIDDLNAGKTVPAMMITYIKQMIYDNNGLVIYTSMPNLTPGAYIAALKKDMLDAKFKRNLDIKIDKMKNLAA